MEGEQCKKLMKIYKSNEVNCTTCKHRFECQELGKDDFVNSRAFDEYKRMMEENKGVYLDGR